MHLAWALLLAHPLFAFEMVVEGGRYDGQEWCDCNDYDGFLLRLRRPGGWLAIMRNLAQASGEHHLLYERCSYASIPIILDGRMVNNPERLDLLVPHGKLSPPFGLVLSETHKSEILVERNWLGRQGVLGGLPSTRTVRQLRFGEKFYEVKPNPAEGNQLGTHVMAVHLCEWLGAEEMPIHESDHPEADFYPLARAENLMGKKVLSVATETFRPYQSNVLSRPRSLLSLAAQRVMTSFEDWDRNYPLVRLRLLLPLALSGPSRMICVLDGVALETCQLEMPNPGWIVLVAGQNLRTDLSQLRPLEDEQLLELRAFVHAQSAEMLAELGKVAGKHYPKWVLQHMRKHGCFVPESV